MMEWRFDQGRLDYFQFDELKKIARALASIDGIKKPVSGEPDTIRKVLAQYSSLPFAPSNYFVWRNYGRVFECLLLATEVKGHILATDLCKKLAAEPDDMDSDDFLAHFVRNFYYSSPIFQGYSPTDPQVFPCVAIIKFLISEYLVKGKNYVNIDEIGGYLIANKVTGLEDIGFYSTLKKRSLSASVDLRQVRELVKFISQFSFLKWNNPAIYLEVANKQELHAIEQRLKPVLNIREKIPGVEILQMGKGFAINAISALTLSQIESAEEVEFTEGRKVRVTHLRSERSSKLKELYFAHTNQPEYCRMCDLDTAKKYPWTPFVIELHHLLPLASPVRVEKGTTSVKDLVGLCPTCHRATHSYYSKWFKTKGVKDFRSYAEAIDVYKEAKSQVVN